MALGRWRPGSRTAPSRRRRHFLKRRRKDLRCGKDTTTSQEVDPAITVTPAIPAAVRVGNYYAEDQEEVLRYIAEVHAGLLADHEWLRKNARKLRQENGLTRRYSVPEILAKQHEADGFDVFVDPEEALLMAERAAKDSEWSRVTRPELSTAEAEEIQEGIGFVIATAAGGSPIGVEEVLELLDRSVAGGEIGAAVYLAEHLEARHDGQPPRPLVERLFQVLKALLRPSAATVRPKLEGPWQKAPPGRFGALNPRKSLGRLLERLAPLRREEKDLAKEGTAEVFQAMERLSQSLLPALQRMADGSRGQRRGQMASLVTRVSQENGLSISSALAQALLQQMETQGLLQMKGRDVMLSNTVKALEAVGVVRSLWVVQRVLQTFAFRQEPTIFCEFNIV
ncbi:unnamed protein product [Durusdinium trenchii]|uniref:Uncharacterized protein n=1 Tax=Durusdinium trenchii TaxID=1381693 RepID=A0ABP0NSG0_9DINO